MNNNNSRNSILVIDDDADLRMLIESIGNACGVHVLQAANCHQGLKVLEHKQQTIKMILLDYYMPGLEPTECASAIIAKAGSSIPVVLLTASADPAARAAELKLQHWLAKPFDISTLENILTGNCFVNERLKQ